MCWAMPFSPLVQSLAFGDVCHILSQLMRTAGGGGGAPNKVPFYSFRFRDFFPSVSLKFFSSVFPFAPLFVFW